METHEARAKRRKNVSFKVEVSQPQGSKVFCNTQNLSIDGISLEMENPDQFRGHRVEIYIHLESRFFEISGLIKRRGKRSLGIKFLKPQPELFRVVSHNRRYGHILTGGHAA